MYINSIYNLLIRIVFKTTNKTTCILKGIISIWEKFTSDDKHYYKIHYLKN